MGKNTSNMTKEQMDNKSNINNPNNPEFNSRMNHHSDQLNSNKGTRGTNSAYDSVQGNRGKQLSTDND